MATKGDFQHPSSTIGASAPLARARRLALTFAGAGACAAVVWIATGLALGAGASPTVKAARSPTLGEIVVSSGGLTVYALAPETTGHLLCKSSQCLQFWPPLTVHSGRRGLKAGAGVGGRLGLLRRSNGTLQVTLAGRPLYRFAGDSARGDTHGQGIQSFGGRWHVIAARATSGSTPAGGGGMPAPASSTPGY